MENTFSIKVLAARLAFGLAIFGCWVLTIYNLTDYILLAIVLILFFGIFTISVIKVNFDEVFIKKNYFWGVFWVRKTIKYDQLISVALREYEFSEDPDFVETRWEVTRICYLKNEEKKDIELRISMNDFRELERDFEIYKKKNFSSRKIQND